MAGRHNPGSPTDRRMGEREAAQGQDTVWAQGSGTLVYDRLRDCERALVVPGLSWLSQDEEEDDEEEEEEEEGSEGYHCQICGYHTDQLQPFNIHLHAAHPTEVLQELYGLLGLTGGSIPILGASRGSIPGLGAAEGPVPGLGPTTGPVPGLGPTTGPVPGLGPTTGPVPGLGPTTGPVPGLGPTTGPVPGLGPTTGPVPGLSPTTGPIPGLGPTTGLIPGLGPSTGPVPGLGPTTDPVPGLGPTTGPISGLGLTTGPKPGLGPTTGPVPGLGPTLGPIPGLSPTTGPVPGLGPTTGPKPGLGPATGPIPGPGPTTSPVPRLGPTLDPIPILGPTTGLIPGLSPSTGPAPGLGPPGCPTTYQILGGDSDARLGQEGSRKGEEGKLEMVHIDLTGEEEEEADEQETAGSGPAPSPEPRLASSFWQAQSEAPREPSPGLELEAEGPLAEAFSRFPYPSPEELARCGRSAGLPPERVRVWFAVQRLRRGISWTPEEVREARDRLGHRPGTLRLPVPPAGLLPVPILASPGREARDGACGAPGGGGGGLKVARSSPDGADSPEALHRQARRPSPAAGQRRWRKTKAPLKARDGNPGDAERGPMRGKAEAKRWFQLRALPASSSSLPLPASQREPARRAEVREGELEEEEASGLAGPSGAVTETASRALLPSAGRPRKSKEQLAALKSFFLLSQWPSGEDYSLLVQRTGLARTDIIQWFGDSRYALKNGQLKWVRRGAGGLCPGSGPPRDHPACPCSGSQAAEWFRRRRGRGRGGRSPGTGEGGARGSGE